MPALQIFLKGTEEQRDAKEFAMKVIAEIYKIGAKDITFHIETNDVISLKAANQIHERTIRELRFRLEGLEK